VDLGREDQLLAILEKFYELNLDLHFLFIDFQHAYGSVNKTHSREILNEFGIPRKVVNLTKITLQDSKGKVKIQVKLTEAF
jgi:hypothetical protein